MTKPCNWNTGYLTLSSQPHVQAIGNELAI